MAIKALVQPIQVQSGGFVVPAAGIPKGIVHLIGGAFIGAAPEVAYQELMTNLSQGGYTVITTPFKLTFKRLECARIVHDDFVASLNELRAHPQRSAWAPENVPVFGCGHSMGSLLHLFIGCLKQQPYASNVLISFNNKEVRDAVPIPGLVDSLRDPATAFTKSDMFKNIPQSAAMMKSALKLTPELIQGLLDPSLPDQLGKVIDQVPSLLNEVGEGAGDFQPSPTVSKKIIYEKYTVPNTLLIKFKEDNIDETSEIIDLLRGRFPLVGVVEASLPGNHLTPCAGDLGGIMGVAEQMGVTLKSRGEQDVQQLSSWLIQWYDRHVDATNRLAENLAEKVPRAEAL